MQRVVVMLLSLLLAGVSAPVAPTTPKPPAGLQIDSDILLPPALVKAADVRWASDHSVYLALRSAGVVEADLDPKGPPPREKIPGGAKLGGFGFAMHVAASSKYIVAAAPGLSLTWRPVNDPLRAEEAFETIQGIDARENRLLLLGARRDAQRNYAPDGVIAWIGSLDKKLADLSPLLYAASGPGARDMAACVAVPLGAARFLSDGTSLVLPGVQPGVYLYDERGKLLRTWDTAALGIDTDCLTLAQQGHHLSRYEETLTWIDQRRTVDAVLPLPQGAGLVVRAVEKGRTRWQLDLLRRDGSVETFPVPLESASDLLHLSGDVRDGKIVLLVYEKRPRDEKYAPPHLLVAHLTAK
jgi:hypothetical protein